MLCPIKKDKILDKKKARSWEKTRNGHTDFFTSFKNTI